VVDGELMMVSVTRTLLPAVVLAMGALGWNATAHATPELQIEVSDGATLLLNTGLVSGGLIGNTTLTDSNFSSIAFSSQGVPILGIPDLSSVTLDATRATASVPVTLTVKITQIGLTGFPSGLLQVSDTTDALIGSFGTINQSTFLDPTNTAFGTGAGTLLNSHNVISTPDAFSVDVTVGPGLTTFSETQIYTINFDSGSASYGGAMQLKVAPIPEPASFSTLSGAGALLLGFSWLRRRRQDR